MVRVRVRRQYAWILFCVLMASAGTCQAARTCESLVALELPDAVVQSAKVVSTIDRGAKAPAIDVPSMCRVSGVAKPSPKSKVRFEVWLPLKDWNGKFQGTGSSGLGGIILYPPMIAAVKAGFASAGSDTGHEGAPAAGDQAWLAEPELVADYGHRAQHATAMNAKAIVREFYGRPPRYSYFVGCSKGGQEAMMEAQRYPDDYDGVVAASPALYQSSLFVSHAWIVRAMTKDPAALLTPEKLRVLNSAVVAACDRHDGVEDGLIDDPRACHFDPGVLQCNSHGDANCLTASQVATARAIYDGPRNPRTAERLFPGVPPGGETWNGPGANWSIYTRTSAVESFFSFGLAKGSGWRLENFDFDADAAAAIVKLGPSIDADATDLSRFARRGGKILLLQGWNDPAVNPLKIIEYYEAVLARQHGNNSGIERGGLEQVRDYFRLFLAPGMGHCGSGPGPNHFDALAVLEKWVEQGVAPASIAATKFQDDDPSKPVIRSRLLCPYPDRARWDGTGEANASAHFTCASSTSRSISRGATP